SERERKEEVCFPACYTRYTRYTRPALNDSRRPASSFRSLLLQHCGKPTPICGSRRCPFLGKLLRRANPSAGSARTLSRRVFVALFMVATLTAGIRSGWETNPCFSLLLASIRAAALRPWPLFFFLSTTRRELILKRQPSGRGA